LKILITGISGFLGRYLIKKLSKHELVGIDINDEIIDNVIVHSSKKINDIDFSPDFIIMAHAAVASGNYSPTTDMLFDVNVQLTKIIIEKFKDAKIIYVSTASIYKLDGNIITENSPIKPISEYAISKLWAENIVLQTKQACILRLSSMYGIGMKENTLIPNYINQAINDKKITIWGDGSRQQNYISVDDVVTYISKIIDNFVHCTNKILLAVSLQSYSNKDIATTISMIVPTDIIYEREDKSISIYYNNEKTTTILNWKPNSNLNEKIAEYIKWKQ